MAIAKTAKSIDEQIEILKGRGLIINDLEYAKAKLLDIGYYRLGFYGYHFEENPRDIPRTHIFKPDTMFEDIIDLYEFDEKLRNILLYYLHKIEVNIRTYVTYTCSIKYKNAPLWFTKRKVVAYWFLRVFKSTLYNDLRERNYVIRNHHKIHECKFAPAWKTLEFFTMGNIENLFLALKDTELKEAISSNYKCSRSIFANYLSTLRVIRNACSHGNCVYDVKLYSGIKSGPATTGNVMDKDDFYNIKGIVCIIGFMLDAMSINSNYSLSEKFYEDLRGFKKANFREITNDIIRKTTKTFCIK